MRGVSVLAGLIVPAWLALGAGAALSDARVPYTLAVQDAATKVGERAAVTARLTPPDGFRISRSYRNRVIELSAYDDGVAFDKRVVLGTIEPDGSVMFEVGVTPTKPGEHPINGVIRASFLTGQRMESKSIPLVATVTGSE